MSRSRLPRVCPPWIALIFGIILTIILSWPLSSFVTTVTAVEPSALEQVTGAWQRAQTSGRYRYTSDINQITYPGPSLVNVGRPPLRDQLYIEGETDVANGSMLLRLWQNGGTVLNPDHAVTVRTRNGRAEVRQGQADWQPLEADVNFFAGASDPLAFLGAIRNVVQVAEPENAHGAHFTFELNGMALATQIRTQMEEQLRRRGELPAGLHLGLNEQYSGMVGQGEIWLDDAGLPLRLTLKTAMPPAENGDQVTATIKSDFAGFDWDKPATQTKMGILPPAWLSTLLSVLPSHQRLTVNLLLFSAAALMIALMLLARRSRWTYGTMATLVILAQVVGPAMQAERLQAASDRLVARYGASTQSAAATVVNTERPANDNQAAPMAMEETNMAALRATAADVNEKVVNRPMASIQRLPMAAPLTQSSGDVTDTDGDGVPDAVELAEEMDPNDADTDGDTLGDGHEYYRLGTDPLSDDSDSDGLSDAKEVAGFLINGQRYYTDPLDPDTNRDGLLDGIECYGQSLLAEAVSHCDDSDGDGFPDIVDDDNDNDLVPDGVDLSPFSRRGKATPYHKNNPFTFRADGLQADKPLYINLQLRPTTPEHLTYALNVLDWPANDTRGNIQRYLDTTWATTNNEALRADDAPAANGDLRVIPLLSIRIPKQTGNFGNLPVKSGTPPLTATSTITDWYNAIDQDKLTPYSMNILKADENTLEVTAPLMMESDATGGGRVAFGAHLYYESGAADSWGSDHEVRVIWLVQMITDVCNDEDQIGTAFCDKPANRHDVQTILHVYDEQWYLTGMNIEEHHGMELGVIFEDPAVDNDVNKDDRLWHLANGLANVFVGGLDADNNDQRDVTIAEIARRWGMAGATDAERWNIPAGATQVITATYPHADYMTQAMMTLPQAILTDYFTQAGTPLVAAPTLLYVRESSYRSANLPEDGSNRLDLTAEAVDLVADLSWKPYAHNAEGNRWENYSLEAYWDEVLQGQLDTEGEFLPTDGTATSQIEAEGNRMIALGYYATLFKGYSNLVAKSGVPLDGDTLNLPEDRFINEIIVGLGGVTKYHAKHSFKIFTGVRKINFAKSSRAAGITAATAVLASVIWQSSNDGDFAFNLQLTSGIVSTVAAVTLLTRTARLYRLTQPAVGSARFVAIGKFAKTTKFMKSSATLGFALNLGEAWGTYIYAVASGNAEADDPALLAHVVAATIMAIMFLVLSIVTLGIFDVVALLFDGIAFIICAATGSSGGLCNGLFAFLTGLLASLFYEVNTFVDMQDPHRLQVSYIHPEIVAPELGMISNNSVHFTVGITNALKPDGPYFNFFGGGRWNEGKIRKAAFAYNIALESQQIHQGLRLGEMYNIWRPNDTQQRYIYTADLTETFPLGARGTGINVPYNIFLNEGFIVPYEECFVFLFVTKCKTRTMSDSNSINISEAAVYDVLPSTFSGFYSLQDQGAGYRLAWSNDGRQLNFPILPDADGDGLRVRTQGGSDPDDGLWDTDGDGLNDKFEHEIGTSPTNADSDFDSLSDARELVLGTDPHRRDSDFDGLEDAAELEGWEFVYALDSNGVALTTWVRSDPTAADPDGDDILDSKEKIFGFHPLVASDPTVLTYNATVTTPASATPIGNGSLYAKSGDVVTYEATVTNELLNRHAYGQLETQVDAGLTNNGTALANMFLLPQETVARSNPIAVDAGVPSGLYRMRQAARATIYDPRTATNEAAVLYSFNDSERPYLDLSGSLPGYHADCSGATCPTLEPNGWVGSALRFDGSDDYLSIPNVGDVIDGGSFTLGAWVYPAAENTGSLILAFNSAAGDNKNMIGWAGTGHFTYYDDTTSQQSTHTFRSEAWYYLTLTINSTGDGVLYVDGYPEITFTTAVRPQATDQFSIGQEWDGSTPSKFFRGLIDEVAIFDRAVALTEIGALMVLPKPAFNLNFDLVEENTNYNTADLYDTTGTHIIAFCPGDSPGCPEFTRGGNWSLGSPYGQHASGPGRIHIGQSNTDPLPDLSHGQFTQSFWVNLVTMEDGKIVLHDTWDGTYFAPWLSFVPDDDENNHDYGKIAVGFLDDATGDRMSFTTPNAVVTSRRWHHIAAVYDGNQYTIYVDGERAADSGTLFNGRKPPRRGDYFVNIPFTVAGIDEVKLYQVALTAAQIKEVYGGGFNLISHLPFEDAPGSTTFDNASDLGNNAYCADATCPATSLPGRVGRAVGFTAANNQLVTLPYAGGQTPVYALTIAAWIKGSGEILSWTHESNGEVLRLDTDSFFVKTFCENGGHCRLGMDSEESETVNFPGSVIPNDEWTHVAVTFDGDWQTYYLGDGSTLPQHQMHLYVNGVEVANKIDSPIGGIILPGNPLQIGDGFNGLIDDLRLYGDEMTAADIAALYQSSAPVLWHRLEENENATSFDDAADHVADSICTSCPQSEVKGQLGLSTHFAGAEWIEAADNSTAAFGGSAPFAVGAWVRPELNNGVQMIVSKSYAVGGDSRGYSLALNNGVPRFWRADSGTGTTLDGPSALPANVWSHLYATFDGTTGRLYLNGQLVAGATGWGSQVANDQGPLLIGAERSNPAGPENNFFYGNIDEVTVYAAALSDREVKRIYDDEVTWVEERSRFELTVDNDDPETAIRSDYGYRANQPTIFDIYANDPTSPIRQVELLVNNVAIPAPACLDAQAEGAYCPTFTPTGEGAYTLVSRATDTVGHQSTSTPVNLLVDATAPNVTLSTSLSTPLRATPHPSELQRWQLSLAGIALDPLLNTGAAGSALHSLEITIYDPAGAIAGEGTQQVGVDGSGNWHLDYLFLDEPDGQYRIDATATDLVGNVQTVTLATVTFDGTAPEVAHTTPLPAEILSDTLIAGGVITDLVSISGVVTETGSGVAAVEIAYVPTDLGSPHYAEASLPGLLMHLPFADDDGTTTLLDITGNGHSAHCHTTCPTMAVAGHQGNAVAFDGSGSRLTVPNAGSALRDGHLYTVAGWFYLSPTATARQTLFSWLSADGSALTELFYDPTSRFFGVDDGTTVETTHLDSYAAGRWVHLALVDSAGVANRLYVNGEMLLGPPLARAVASTDQLRIGVRGGDSAPSQFFAGIADELQLYDRPLSTAEVGVLYRGDRAVLRLNFEESFATDGFTITETSGWAHTLSLQSGDALNKADVGIVGNRALRLDGTDDYLTVQAVSTLAAGDAFAFGGWFNPASAFAVGEGTIMAFADTDRSARNSLRYAYATNQLIYDDGQSVHLLPDTYDREEWHHLFATVAGDGETILYVDAIPVLTTTTTLHPTMGGHLDIGRQRSAGGAATNYFAGVLDELLVYPRVLNALEVQMLYRQGWQTAQVTGSSWTAPIPAAMEGLFEIELRAADGVGNLSPRRSIWRGIIDNLAPRVSIEPNGGVADASRFGRLAAQPTMRTEVRDFNLSVQNYSTGCGLGVVDDATTYTEAWYLAFTDESAPTATQLYTLASDCSQESNLSYTNACDAYGNCILSMVPALPQVWISDQSVVEGALLAFPITLDHGYPYPLEFSYRTLDTSATAPADYVAISGTLVIPADTISVTITIPTTDDELVEGSEAFAMQISSTLIAITEDTAAVTIHDDDQAVFNIDTVVGAESSGQLTFTLRTAQPLAAGATIYVSTQDGSATIADADYIPLLNEAVTMSTTGMATVGVSLVDDAKVEANESFSLTIASITADRIGMNLVAGTSGRGTIANDDFAPTATPAATPTATPTVTPTVTATATNTPLPTASATPMPTATDIAPPTATATNMPQPTATVTIAPSASATETSLPTVTRTTTPLLTATATGMPSATMTPIATPTLTLVPTTPPTAIPTNIQVILIPTAPAVAFSEESDATHPEASPAGRFHVDVTFVNQGTPLTDLFFVVAALRSEEPTVLHHLLNADDPPGQEGATLTLANHALPGGNRQWDSGETMAVAFELGLMARRRFIFALDLYSNATPVAAGEGAVFLGRFDFVYDPAQMPTATQPRIFLPLIQRANFKVEQGATGAIHAICQDARCLVAAE